MSAGKWKDKDKPTCNMHYLHPEWGLCRAAKYNGRKYWCDALNDTNFGKCDCPFYKTKGDYEFDQLQTAYGEKHLLRRRLQKLKIKPGRAQR